MRELVYYVAITLDGFIAHPDGSFDKFPWDPDYGADMAVNFPETVPAHLRSAEHRSLENRWFDAVLMGRNTYEVGLKEGISSPYPTLRQYVFSRSYSESPNPDVTLISGNAVEAVQALKREDGKAIWLCGGAALASTLLTAGLIDRLILRNASAKRPPWMTWKGRSWNGETASGSGGVSPRPFCRWASTA